MHAELDVQPHEAPVAVLAAALPQLHEALEQALGEAVAAVLLQPGQLPLYLGIEHVRQLFVVADQDDPAAGAGHRDHQVKRVRPRRLVHDDCVEQALLLGAGLDDRPRHGLLAGGSQRHGVSAQGVIHGLGITAQVVEVVQQRRSDPVRRGGHGLLQVEDEFVEQVHDAGVCNGGVGDAGGAGEPVEQPVAQLRQLLQYRERRVRRRRGGRGERRGEVDARD